MRFSLRNNPLWYGSALLVGSSLLVGGLNFIFTILMGRMLGPIGFGTLTALTSLLYIIGVPAQSLNTVVVRFVAELSALNHRHAIWYLYLRFIQWLAALGGVTIVITYLGSQIVADFLHIDDRWLIVLLALIVVFGFVVVLSQSVLQGLQKFFLYSLLDVSGVVAKFTLGVFLVWLGWGVRGAFWAIFVANITPLLIALIFILPLRKGEENRKALITRSQVRHFVFPSLVAFFGLGLLSNQDVVLVKRFLSPLDAGSYAALVMFGKILLFVTAAVAGVIFPLVTSRFVAGKDYRQSFLKGFWLVVLICVSFLGLFLIFPDFLVNLLFGSMYSNVATNLFFAGVVYLFFCLCYVLIIFFLAVKQTLVAILPLFFALLQMILLILFHNGLRQVLSVNAFSLSLLLLLLLFLYNDQCLLERFNQWIKRNYSR